MIYKGAKRGGSMAQPHPSEMMHYRLFATLIMFLTLLLGLGIGWFGGFSVGQRNAKQLLEEGRTAEATTVDEQAAAANDKQATEVKLAECYQETLGKERYNKWTAGEGLTVTEVIKIFPCENLKNQ
jgi:hypothetical protein